MTNMKEIQDILSNHQWFDATDDPEDPAIGCIGCDDWLGSEDALDDGSFAAHQTNELAKSIRKINHDVWETAYNSGVEDERTSEMNMGVQGCFCDNTVCNCKLEPARENPYNR